MNTNSHDTPPRRHSPVKDLSSRQLRTVRKELLLLRAEVERTEFVQARVDLRQSMSRFGWLKLLMPKFFRARSKSAGKNVNASLTDWFTGHPLLSSLASAVLAKPLRATLAAGTKPLAKWGAVGVAGWAGYQALAHYLHRRREKEPTSADSAGYPR